MSVLNITTDLAGKVIDARVDDKVIENVTEVSQSFVRGELLATIKAVFDTINVTEQAGTPAPTITVAFAVGTVAGSTKATITGTAGAGNHFAYAVSDTTPATPNVGDAVVGSTTYVSGNNITGVVTDKVVAIYELTSDNKVVKFAAHTLIADEIYAGA